MRDKRTPKDVCGEATVTEDKLTIPGKTYSALEMSSLKKTRWKQQYYYRSGVGLFTESQSCMVNIHHFHRH